MLGTLRFILVVLGGVLLGLFSAWIAVEDPRFDFTRTIGPWRLVDLAPGNDPYALARSSRNGMVGLGPTEGVTFAAFKSSDGRFLSPDCSYRVEGPVPKDVPWTLTIADRDWRLPDNPAGRTGFTVYDVMRYQPGNVIRIGFGRDVQPGDFIPTGELRSLSVLLRIYTVTAAKQPLLPSDLPSIVRLDCPGEKPR